MTEHRIERIDNAWAVEMRPRGAPRWYRLVAFADEAGARRFVESIKRSTDSGRPKRRPVAVRP